MAKTKWMKSAVPESHKGIFKEKAEHAGKSTEAFAHEHRNSPGKLGKEARLALTFAKMRPSMAGLRHKMHGTKE